MYFLFWSSTIWCSLRETGGGLAKVPLGPVPTAVLGSLPSVLPLPANSSCLIFSLIIIKSFCIIGEASSSLFFLGPLSIRMQNSVFNNRTSSRISVFKIKCAFWLFGLLLQIFHQLLLLICVAVIISVWDLGKFHSSSYSFSTNVACLARSSVSVCRGSSTLVDVATAVPFNPFWSKTALISWIPHLHAVLFSTPFWNSLSLNLSISFQRHVRE